jgi:hypothetical protein
MRDANDLRAFLLGLNLGRRLEDAGVVRQADGYVAALGALAGIARGRLTLVPVAGDLDRELAEETGTLRRARRPARGRRLGLDPLYRQ